MKRLLIVSNMYPSPIAPYFGIFVRRQVRALEGLGVECELAVSSRTGGSAGASIRKYARLAERAWHEAGTKPEAVITHFVFPTGAIGLAAARRAKAPLVVVAHGGDVAAGKPFPVRAATSAVLERAELVVAVSAEVAAEAKALGAPSDRMLIASMGYDDEMFFPRSRAEARKELGLDANTHYAVLVGNLIHRKGVGVVIEAAAKLRSLLPNVRWLLVGGGPEKAKWERRALDAGTRDVVRFVGPAAPEDVPRWIAAADVAVVPSLREPFGVAALEAIACGVPVIASRTGGLTEIISDGETGVLVEPGDAETLAGALVKVLGDDSFRERLGAAGPRAAAPHTATAMAGRLLGALEGLART